MKKLFLLIALSSSMTHAANAQANDWHFFPDFKMDAATGTFATFPAGSAITSCSTGNHYKRPGVLSNTTTGTYLAYNVCGYFDNSGNNLFQWGSQNMLVFDIPAVCDEYYSVEWVESRNGGERYNNFVLNRVTTAGGVTVTSTPLVQYVLLHDQCNFAVSPMEPGGYRTIYAAYGTNLEAWLISPQGNLTSLGIIANLPNEPSILVNMEVTSDGKYIVIVTQGSSNSSIYLYKRSNNTFQLISSSPVISGVEYIPGSFFGPGQSARLYMSYQNPGNANISYVELATMAFSNAIQNIPNTSPFGYTEIELAENGLLYIASNPNYLNNQISGPGELYTLDPISGNANPVFHNFAAVPVKSWNFHYNYNIQNQIDGENYNRRCEPRGCNSHFAYSVDTRFPQDVIYSPEGGGAHKWIMGDGSIHNTNGYGGITYTYPVSNQMWGTSNDITDHPWDVCSDYAEFCLRAPVNDIGDPNIQTGDPSINPTDLCDQSSDFIVSRHSYNTYDINLTPIGGAEPYYYITWGDPSPPSSSTVPMSWVHTYPGAGSYTLCLQTGYGSNCRTCLDLCITDRIAIGAATDPHEKPGSTTVSEIKTGPNNLELKSVVPNPAIDDIKIEMTSAANEDITVMLTDMTGKVVLTKKRTVYAGLNTFNLSLENLSSGLYILNLNGKNETLRSKIIKQ